MLAELEARGFRNLMPVALEMGAGAHLILGENGAGKTSLLEAIYLLATTRSFRAAQLSDCCRHGADSFYLRAEVSDPRRARLEISCSEGKRARAVNGKRSSLAEHLSVLPVVLWTAADGEILTGAPDGRRRLLDRGVVGLHPATLGIIARYREALAEKRHLLSRGIGEVAPWNRVLAGAAAELIRRRAAYAEKLATALDQVLQECSLGLARVELRYRPSPRRGLEGVETIENEMEAARDRELHRRQPLVGPHRDDLEVSWDGHELRRVASAGERKAFGLALLAAHARVLTEAGRAPIFLLDDADTELDRRRLEALWRAFLPVRQLFATSNRSQVWEGIAIDHHWRCEQGKIEQL